MMIVPIKTKAGDTLPIEFNITDEAGEPSDLTGAEIRWGYSAIPVAGQAMAAPVLTLTEASPEITVTAGKVRIDLPKGLTAAGRYYHELEITTPSGESTTVAEGTMIVTAAVFAD